MNLSFDTETKSNLKKGIECCRAFIDFTEQISCVALVSLLTLSNSTGGMD